MEATSWCSLDPTGDSGSVNYLRRVFSNFRSVALVILYVGWSLSCDTRIWRGVVNNEHNCRNYKAYHKVYKLSKDEIKGNIVEEAPSSNKFLSYFCCLIKWRWILLLLWRKTNLQTWNYYLISSRKNKEKCFRSQRTLILVRE